MRKKLVGILLILLAALVIVQDYFIQWEISIWMLAWVVLLAIFITTIVSFWASRTQPKTILCFTRRIEEDIQANNCKNRREDNDRIRYWKKMELPVKWKKSHNAIGETKSKMSLQKTRKGQNSQ